MGAVVVAESRDRELFDLPDVEVVDPSDYLTNPCWHKRRGIKVFNLCRSYEYQSLGYYVSLLAEARGHRPLPSVMTIQDIGNRSAVQMIPNSLDQTINKLFEPLVSKSFTLSVYFGRNLAQKYDRLSRELHNHFPSPMMRYEFTRGKTKWRLRSASPIGSADIPASHRPFVIDAAMKYFSRGTFSISKRSSARYDIAILHNPEEGELAPSDEKALQKMVKAAASVGLAAELLTPADAGRVLEFDALFLRETTAVNHHTYRLARKAEREGLVVMDDPLSILRCTNKVYLAEILHRAKIPTPRTIVAHQGNAHLIAEQLGLPTVLKQPDSAFSKGVTKVETEKELAATLKELFASSELVVAQEFMPTDFDWRIGVLDRRPLFACKYHMASGHWQIIQADEDNVGKPKFGNFETVPVELAPRKAVAMAVKAADLIGDGLYGVDIKESNGQFVIIEVNDNPNLDAGVEDKVMREELYRRVMESFVRRIERKKSIEVTA